MTIELQCPLKFNIGTIRKPKFRIFDLHGSTAFTISSATFSLKDTKTGVQVDSGTALVNNSDTDAAGNTIKTVQPTLSLDPTDPLSLGPYQLSVRFVLVGGESDVFRQPVEMVDYEEVT